MKKLFLLAALVGVALTGCMKNEVYVPKCETPISFEVANYVAQTRAGEFDTDETFGVDAWSYDATAGTVKIMENEVVSYTNNQWAPSQTYYWPINGTVDFIAYYPKTSKPTDISYNYNGTDAITYTNYIVGEEDLMYADKAIRYSQNVSAYGFTGVPTVFRHALAKVNFQVQNAHPTEDNNADITYEIVVDQITLNTYNKGSVTLKTDATATDATAILSTWSVANNVWNVTADSTTPLTWTSNVNLADNSVVAYAARDQYVLPQTLEDDVTVTVKYTVSQYQMIDSTKTLISKKQYNPDAIKLNTMGLPSWQMNKNITYTISIIAKSNQILFAPHVEEWATATGATTIQ